MGNRLIFLYHVVFSRKALTLGGMLSGTVIPSKHITLWSTVMVRIRRKCDGVTQQIP